MTRNLYLGAELGSLLVPGTDLTTAATAIWAQVRRTDFPARAAALAAEIAADRPHAVGLQEVTTYTEGPFPTTEFPSTVVFDFLELLLAELEMLGSRYEVAVVQPLTALALPVLQDGDTISIGFRDAIAILVRDDVSVGSTGGDRYEAGISLPLPASPRLARGWAGADVSIDGIPHRIVTTHLEGQHARATQVAQATELLSVVDGSERPVVLLGDFNSAANPDAPPSDRTASYGLIRDAGFDDLWLTAGGGASEGLTCCHLADLSNAAAAFEQRLDLVLFRGGPDVRLTDDPAVTVVGADTGDRVSSDGRLLWPSDHAGVVASLEVVEDA